MRAVLVDDEYSNRVLLENQLKKHCPDVEITGVAECAETAYAMINRLKPDLIFLDVSMPGQNGIDLLRRFHKIQFSVIFVTGFGEYAIKAFEFNAIDYILKPFDYTKLISAVEKARTVIYSGSENLIHFVHSIEEKTNYIKKINIHGKDKVHVIDLGDIVCIAADRGYCEIFDVKRQRYISARPLTDYEELLEPFSNFIRVNKSYIVNIDHINSYTKGTECFISMKSCDAEIEVSRRKKTEIIAVLKNRVPA